MPYIKNGRSEKMKRFLIASHGTFASGLKKSIQILTGKENISTIDAYLDGSANKTSIDLPLTKFLNSLSNHDYGIIFTDLAGGSVNQEITLKTNNYKNVFVITSVNLPSVLSVILDTERPTKKRLQSLIIQSPVQLSELSNNSQHDSDDDFLS